MAPSKIFGTSDLASSLNFLAPSRSFNILDNFSCRFAERKLCSWRPFSNILNRGLFWLVGKLAVLAEEAIEAVLIGAGFKFVIDGCFAFVDEDLETGLDGVSLRGAVVDDVLDTVGDLFFKLLSDELILSRLDSVIVCGCGWTILDALGLIEK